MSELQRRTAAKTARSNFIKYPEWFDDRTGAWTALSNHPSYEMCRKIRSNPGRLAELNPKLCDLWAEDDLGLYLFVMYVGRMMGSRPTHSYRLAAIDDSRPFEPGNLTWRYRLPSRKRRFAEADARARAASGALGGEGGGAPMPEGKAKKVGASDARYLDVEEAPHSPCVCSPSSFWVDCDCEIAIRARYEVEEDLPDEGEEISAGY